MSKQLRCVIIDDELLALSYLRALCEEISDIIIIKAYDDPQKLLDEIGSLDVDLCISDIVMPSMNGLELAEELKKIPVIFTTAHNEYAADAFDVQAVDYLRKPVKKERLIQALEKVRNRPENQKSEQIQFTTAKGKMRIHAEDIAFVSAETFDRRDKLMVLKTGEEQILKNYSFEQITALLPAALFIRISRKDLLSKSIVKGHSSGKIFSSFSDKSGIVRTFTLGENYRKDFLEQF